jgi:hypothetical protein
LCKDDINQYSRAMEVPLQQEAMEWPKCGYWLSFFRSLAYRLSRVESTFEVMMS